ncbi:MAG: hypothetical protein JSR70_03340 [Proteobacteria bacterium]|nr:hypothetical protein [Pseudomonadota bacterium]
MTFAANYSLTENLFEAAADGHERGCPEFYESCKQILMDWARKGGRHETGWGILETAVNALVALVINESTPAAVTALKTKFREMLSGEGAPPPDVRTRAATRLARSADEFRYSGATHSRIDGALAQLDQAAVRALIHEMAQILAVDPPAQPQPGHGDL